MVVMIMAEQYSVDLRQGLEGDPGRPHAPGAGERQWACPVRPYGISKDVETTRLDQHARVANNRRSQSCYAGIRHGVPHRDRARPWGGSFHQLPAQQVTKAAVGCGVIRIEEPQAVEMVAR